jgi:vitamin B12 transporter
MFSILRWIDDGLRAVSSWSFSCFLRRSMGSHPLSRWLVSCIGGLSLAAGPLHAQKLEEVVVTATRSDQTIARSLADVVVIDSQQIRDAAGSTIAELLRAAAGIEIAQNGGAGALTELYVRGTKTAQTVVLIDGVRIEDPFNGSARIEFLPLSAIDRIEVVRGPTAAFYGSGAMGGVIQIFTRESRGPLRSEWGIAAGSRGTGQLQGRVSGGDERTRYMVSAVRDTTRGYEVTRPGSGLYTQIDDDSNRQTSFTGLISHRLTRDLQAGFQWLATEGNLEYDLRGYEPSQTVSNYRTRSGSLFLRGQMFSVWDSEIRLGNSQLDYDYYVFSSAPRIETQSVGWQNTLAASQTMRLLFGADSRRQAMEGLGVTEGDSRYTQTRRTHNAGYAGVELDHGIHQLRLVARSDRVTGLSPESTALLAWGVRPEPGWLVRASVGSSFRVPTFNDVFSPWGANPNLRPERSVGQELAIERQSGERYARAIVFNSRIRDAIELDSNYSPQNLALAKVVGLTAEAGLRIGPWRLRGSVTRQQPTAERPDDQTGETVSAPLARRAKAYGVVGADWNSGPWRAGINVIAQGERRDTSGERLGGYAIVDLWGSRRLSQGLDATLRLGNLADRYYETALGFRSPPRSVLLGLRYTPGN